MLTGPPRPADRPRRPVPARAGQIWHQKRWRLTTLVVAATLALGAVAVRYAVFGGSADNGPLGVSRPVDGFQCIPVDFGPKVILAGEVLRNAGTAPVVVDSVRVAGGSGINVDEALLAPIKDNTLLGYQSYPPPVGGEVLAERRPAVGATVDAGQELNLVLIVSVNHRPARVDWIEVDYHQGRDRFVRRYSTTVTFKQPC